MGPQLELYPLEDGWEGAPFRPGRTSNSNAVSVAIPQPRVAGEARYPGYPPHQPCNAVSVAFSRRRYPQRDFHGFGTFDNFPLRVTPTANRNSFRVALSFIIVPRVEALRTSTLGYEIATPTELPRVRTIHSPFTTDNHKPRPTNPSHPTDTHKLRPTNPSHHTDSHKPRPTNPSHTTDNHAPRPTNPPHTTYNHAPRPTNPPHTTYNYAPQPTNPSHTTDSHTTLPTNPSHTTDNHTPLLPNSVRPVTISTFFLMTSMKIMTISAIFLMTSTNFLTTSATLETTSANFLTNSAGSYRPKRVYVPSETCIRAV